MFRRGRNVLMSYMISMYGYNGYYKMRHFIILLYHSIGQKNSPTFHQGKVQWEYDRKDLFPKLFCKILNIKKPIITQL
jgi:hypothetical protein